MTPPRRGAAAVRAAFTVVKPRPPALVAYLMAGYPDPGRFLAAAEACLAAGADVLEFGVPYSDPVADGPVIQAAGEAALKQGMTLARALDLAVELRRRRPEPVLLMSYLNPVLAYGAERLAEAAASRGLDGLIIPDLPLAEAGNLRAILTRHDLAFTPFAPPNAGEERLRQGLGAATGFLYVLGLEGVTGERRRLDSRLADFLARLRAFRGAEPAPPLAVGFGLSTPAHITGLRGLCEGVIVGSALVRRAADGPEALSDFIRTLKNA